MLLQTNSYVVPKEKRNEHARLVRRFRQTLARLGCEHFEVYEQVSQNWSGQDSGGRFVQIMRFRDRRQQLDVQAAERSDPAAQALIAEFCELINFPFQQQQGLFAVGFYNSVLTNAPSRESQSGEEDTSAAPSAPNKASSDSADATVGSPASGAMSAAAFGAFTSVPEDEFEPVADEASSEAVAEQASASKATVPVDSKPNIKDFAELISKLPPEELKLAVGQFARILTAAAPDAQLASGSASQASNGPESRKPAKMESQKSAVAPANAGESASGKSGVPKSAAMKSVVPNSATVASTPPGDGRSVAVMPIVIEPAAPETSQQVQTSQLADASLELALEPEEIEAVELDEPEIAASPAPSQEQNPAPSFQGMRLVKDEIPQPEVPELPHVDETAILANLSRGPTSGDSSGEQVDLIFASEEDSLLSELDLMGEPVELHQLPPSPEPAPLHLADMSDSSLGMEPLGVGDAVEPTRSGNGHHAGNTRSHMRLAQDSDPHDDEVLELFEPDEPVSPFGT